MATSLEGLLPDPPASGLMSLTITVPAAVPSLFHSSRPFVPSSALKKSMPPTAVSAPILLSFKPGAMSFTITVPAAVPSLFHSSRLMLPSASLALKYSVLPTGVKSLKLPDTMLPGLMFLTGTVPAAVPSVFQSTCPLVTVK